MNHETTLRKYFAVNTNNSGWISFETLDEGKAQRFRTKRIGKLIDGERFLFTIGETLKGKSNQLSAGIESLIRENQLKVIRESTTDGNAKNDKNYVGFDLSDSLPSLTVERLLKGVFELIDNCK